MKFYNKTLNKKFWSEDKEFDPEIRKKLMSITNDFIDKLNLDFGAKNPKKPIDNNEFLSNGEINPNYNPANNPDLFKPRTVTKTRISSRKV